MGGGGRRLAGERGGGGREAGGVVRVDAGTQGQRWCGFLKRSCVELNVAASIDGPPRRESPPCSSSSSSSRGGGGGGGGGSSCPSLRVSQATHTHTNQEAVRTRCCVWGKQDDTHNVWHVLHAVALSLSLCLLACCLLLLLWPCRCHAAARFACQLRITTAYWLRFGEKMIKNR